VARIVERGRIDEAGESTSIPL